MVLKDVSSSWGHYCSWDLRWREWRWEGLYLSTPVFP